MPLLLKFAGVTASPWLLRMMLIAAKARVGHFIGQAAGGPHPWALHGLPPMPPPPIEIRALSPALL